MKRKKWNLLFAYTSLLILCISPICRATSDFQIWSQLQPGYHLSESAKLGALVQWRFGRGNADQILTDLNTTYHLSSLYLEGGLVTLSKTHPLFSQLEWRPWLGLGHKTKGNLTWNNRLRSEFRFLSGNSGVLVRLRYLTDLSFGKLSEAFPFHPFVNNELFFHVNSQGPAHLSGFDQNRLQAGLKWDGGGGFSVAAAYLNLYLKKPGSDLMVHIPFLSFAIDLNDLAQGTDKESEFKNDNPSEPQ